MADNLHGGENSGNMTLLYRMDISIYSWPISRWLWSPYVIGQTIIFLPCGYYLVS